MPKERPASLTGPADGQTLEQLIGDLQSEWGVPQYPQEYRITIKVAEEHLERVSSSNEAETTAAVPGREPTAPRRERAPAAPRVAAAVEREPAPKRRRGRRRRRRGKAREDGPTALGQEPSEGSQENPSQE